MTTTSCFAVEITNFIAKVKINKPEKANSLDLAGWQELRKVFEDLDQNSEVRVVILQATGKHFCSGMDLSVFLQLQQTVADSCEGKKREKLRRFILDLQTCVSAISNCRKPVLAAIQGGCIGGGLDIAAACDMRYATENAVFCIKEVDLGIVADLGALQRLPAFMPQAVVREMAYTGKNLSGKEAVAVGLANQCFATQEEMLAAVEKIASTIAEKSPLVVRGIKETMDFSASHAIQDGLNFVATWNSATMLSNDMLEAAQAAMQKRKAVFVD
jgi:enoyl-CoA hydratase